MRGCRRTRSYPLCRRRLLGHEASWDPPAVERPETARPLSATEARQMIAAAQAHRNAAR